MTKCMPRHPSWRSVIISTTQYAVGLPGKLCECETASYSTLRPQGGCEWAAIAYFVVDQSTPFFRYLTEECLCFRSCSISDQCTSKVENWPKLGHNWGGGWRPHILWGSPQIVDPISKITPISDLLSYEGCLSVERPRTLGGKRKKRNFCWKIEYLRSTLRVGGGIIIL